LCVKHPGILAGKRESSSFATTAKFSRFPNKNPKNTTLAKERYWTIKAVGFAEPAFKFAASDAGEKSRIKIIVWFSGSPHI
jgi:hypothetical protein